MCTLIVLLRPDTAWPLIVAGNRDEMQDRPWLPPGRHWPDRPEVVAGLDQQAEGSWFGVNTHGVVAVIMNRYGSLGSSENKRSRGELVLEALDHGEAGEAARALAQLNPAAYRGFNLFIGDPVSAYWLRHEPENHGVELQSVTPGLHMLTAGDLDDRSVPRIRLYLPRFREAAVPDPENGSWAQWEGLLASRDAEPADDPHSAMNITAHNGFGTLCSHLVAVPRHPGYDNQDVVFRFANGPPDQVRFHAVDV